jgi:hypothetical protein
MTSTGEVSGRQEGRTVASDVEDDLSPLSHPLISRVCCSFALSPVFGSPEGRVFRLSHDGWLAAPPEFSNVIGTFCPIAPCGRCSL